MRFIMSLLLLVHVAADVSTVHVAADISTVHPSSFYWNMDGARTSSAGAGFSFYSHIFSLFSESVGGLPDQMQMGLGGTWLTPTNISWSTLAPGVCACDPNGWPSATKGDPAFGCCETDARCSFLYETFEGGPGYWIGMLPTAQPKWRVNSAVGCYRDQASTPLFNFGEAGKPHSCESMGIAQLSNRMLMAPDGLTFAAGAQGMGMVGVAYVRTPLGKTSDADVRNFWTILVDTADFAGPLGYFIPEFWAERWDSPNPSPASAAIGDLGKPGVGLSMGGGAFEWNTLYNFKHESSGSYKVPAMALPLGPDGRTTLFQDARGYESADVYEPLEAALAAGALNASRVLAGGSPMQCTNGSTAATYRLEGSDAAHLIPVGTLRTTVNSEGVARWAFEPDPKITPALDGKLPEYYSAALEPITAADAPADLVKARFPSKSDMGAYDGLSHPPSGGCASSPGPADEGHLHCVQTSSPSWIGYKWYKFVEQPAFLRAKLSGSEAAYLQGRVETLHRMLQGGGDEASRWIKQRGTPEALATVDGAQLVTPPPGFEVGYVPIALYEGVAKPHGCVSTTTTTAEPEVKEAAKEEEEATVDKATADAEVEATVDVHPEPAAPLAACHEALDCSLNGECVASACVCDPGWRGSTCSVLDLLPARKLNGYKMPTRSSWGGSVLHDGDTWHMFVEEIVGACGLNTYARNMRIAHAVSASGRPDGPYRAVNLVTNYSASTPHAMRDPANGDWLVFGTGCGRGVCLPVAGCEGGVTPTSADLYPCPPSSSANTSANPSAAAAAPGLPNGSGWSATVGAGHAQPCQCPAAPGTSVPGPECSVDWASTVWRSASADGPWELTAPLLDVHHPEMSHADGTPVVFANPSALLLANGTAALMFRDYLQKLPFPSTNVIGLAWSHHGWQGPYEAADVQPQIFPDYAEDPHIYRDRRGHWHMLAHSLCDEWPECPAVGGHAASVDGRAWRYTSAAAYTTTVEFEDGESVTFSRRERPELLMDAQGHPSYLITGVVDKGGGGMEDRSWTLVQPIRGPAGARR